jgi:2',3'-cyclic-nucleotide 2'-phosphodiesterase
LDEILEKTKNEKLAGIIVDAHMETTSEKQVLAHYFDGRVSAVIGTHTHIPTADERILPQGTAFITDAGMVGLQETSLGVDLEPVTREMLTQLPQTFTWSEAGLCRVDGVLIEIKSAQTAVSIKRINRTVEI